MERLAGYLARRAIPRSGQNRERADEGLPRAPVSTRVSSLPCYCFRLVTFPRILPTDNGMTSAALGIGNRDGPKLARRQEPICARDASLDFRTGSDLTAEFFNRESHFAAIDRAIHVPALDNEHVRKHAVVWEVAALVTISKGCTSVPQTKAHRHRTTPQPQEWPR
jgi:hypothetical protein